MGNNWINFVDPDGGLCQDAQGNTIPCPDGYGAFNGIADIGVFDGGEFQGYGLDEVFIFKPKYEFRQGSSINTNENGPWNFKWGNSDNILASLSYNITNDAFQVVQALDVDLIPSGGTNPLTGSRANLNIDGTSNNTPTDGFVNTVSTLIPISRGLKSVSSLAPKGLGSLKKLNAARFSQMFKGNLARLAPAMRGRLNNILNKSVNFINNQVANGMLLLHSLKFKSEE